MFRQIIRSIAMITLTSLIFCAPVFSGMGMIQAVDYLFARDIWVNAATTGFACCFCVYFWARFYWSK